MVDDPIAAAMARAQRYADEARAESESDLVRIRRENPDFAQWVDTFRALFRADLTYLHEPATGKTWGMTVEERAKRDGGIGVSVPASGSGKPKRGRGATKKL